MSYRITGYPRLLADVAQLTPKMAKAPGQVIVVCNDRYHFTVALLAAWEAGHTVALPPNGRDATIERIRDALGATILHDTDHSGGIDLRNVVGHGEVGPPLHPIDADRVVATLYTSGSTGDFQPCPKTARQLFEEVKVLAVALKLGPGDRVLGTVPPHHLYGLLFTVLLPLVVGSEITHAAPLHAEAIAEQAHDAALIVTVPAHLAGFERLPAGTLAGKTIVSSTAPLALSLAAAVVEQQQAKLVEVLGSTETGGIALRESAPGQEMVRAWTAMPGVDIAVEHDQLVVTSPFAPHPRYRTADRVILEGPTDAGEARFLHLGRADDVVKVGGRRVSLGAIEARIGELDGVDDVKVLAVPEPGSRNVRVLAAVATRDARWTPMTLRGALERWLEVVPRRFVIVPELPREPNGKLTRERVLQLFGPPTRLRLQPAGVGAKGNERLFTVDVPPDVAHFDGHFPGFPILPGVSLVHDAVLPAIASLGEPLGALELVTRLKFRRPIGPGEQLQVRLVILPERTFDFFVSRGAVQCSSGRLQFGLPA